MSDKLLVIHGRLDGLNNLIDCERTHRQMGAKLKRKNEAYVRMYIRQQLRGYRPKTPVKLHYYIYERNRKRDLDNVFSFCAKVVQDSLVKEGIIDNDGWAFIDGFTAQFFVDPHFPRIEVEIEESNKKGHHDGKGK